MVYMDDIAAEAQGTCSRPMVKELVRHYEKDHVSRLLKRWKSYAVNLQPPIREIEMMNPFSQPPQIPWVKSFFKWRVRIGKGSGRLSKDLCVKTLLKEFEQMRRYLHRAHNHLWSRTEVDDLKQHIKNLAKSEGASTATRSKSVAYAVDANEMQYYVWNCSEYPYAHPRLMVQFSVWLDIISIWGLRTGEVVESSAHKYSNEGILYGDVDFSLTKWQGLFRYQIKIWLRNRKFHREDKGQVKAITLKEHMNTRERFKCPVRKFLALALADEVFVHQQTPEDFETRWMLPTAASRSFEIKKKKQNVPIFRRMEGNQFSETKIWTAIACNQFLKEVGEQCGYKETVTTYSFRRGVANKVEANASAKGTKEVLGHKGDRTWHAYAAPTIGVDAQAIAYDEPQDTEFTAFSQSIAFTRDIGGPKPPSSAYDSPSLPTAQLLKQFAENFPGRRTTFIMKKAREEQYRLNRETFFKASASENWTIVDTISDGNSSIDSLKSTTISNNGKQETTIRVSPEATDEFKHRLKYDILQKRVIEAFWGAHDASLSDCVHPMMALATPKPFQALYPSPASPPTDEGTCPYCDKNMVKQSASWVAWHLLECHCKTRCVQFCFDCATFFDEDHTCPDFHQRSHLYGLKTWRGLIIRAGRCPYGNNKGCAERQWLCASSLKAHVIEHLKELPDRELTCPHQNCGESSTSQFEMRKHLQSIHKIRLLTNKELIANGLGYENEISNEPLEIS